MSRLAQLATLFREAGAAHHQAFARTNGDDPEWATWYAEFLVPRLAGIVDRRLGVAEMAELLVAWDREQARTMAPETWPEFYARRLLSLRDPVN